MGAVQVQKLSHALHKAIQLPVIYLANRCCGVSITGSLSDCLQYLFDLPVFSEGLDFPYFDDGDAEATHTGHAEKAIAGEKVGCGDR